MPNQPRPNPTGRSRRHRGTVLLLALLVLSSITIASSGVATLILSSLQQTRTIDSSIIAYYAAESSAEQAIYVVRKTPLEPDWAESLTVAAPQQQANGASWTRTVAGKERVISAQLPRDSFIELALYDPDREGISLADAIKRVAVSWTNDPCVPEDDTCPKLVATLVKWSPGTTTWSEDASKTERFTTGVDGVPPAYITLSDVGDLYKLRLRAEDADIRDLRVQAYADDAMNTPVDLPGRIKIDTWGRYGTTQQHLTARLPRRMPLSGMYDFAVFSECSLVKGYPISCP